MATNMPYGLDTFTNPTGTSQQNDSAVLHHAQHDGENDAIYQIEQIMVGPPWLNVRGLGAGAGGDDTAYFAQAFSTLSTNGGQVYMPPGTYNISGLPNFNTSNISLVGAGSELVTINHTGTANLINVNVNSSGQPTTFKIQGFTINSANSSATANGISWIDTIGGTIQDIKIANYTQTGNRGLWIKTITGTIDGLIVRDLIIDNVTNGIVFDAANSGALWQDIKIDNLYFVLPSNNVAQTAISFEGNGTLQNSYISARGMTSASVASSPLNTVLNLSANCTLMDSALYISSSIRTQNYAPQGFVIGSGAKIVNCSGIVTLNTSNGKTFLNYSGNTSADMSFYGVWDVYGITALVTKTMLTGTSASSPIKAPNIGDSYFQTDTGRVVLWSGSGWVSSNLNNVSIGGVSYLNGTLNFNGISYFNGLLMNESAMYGSGSISINGPISTSGSLSVGGATYIGGTLTVAGAMGARNGLSVVGDIAASGRIYNGGGQTITSGWDVISTTGNYISNGSTVGLWVQSGGTYTNVLSILYGSGSADITIPPGIPALGGGLSMVIVPSSQQVGVASSRTEFKENIKPLGEIEWSREDNPIFRLRPVHFNWKDIVGSSSRTDEGLQDKTLGRQTEEVGFLVEDIHAIAPHLTVDGFDGAPLQYKDQSLIALLTEGLQYIKAELDQTKQELKELKEKI